MKPLSIHSHSTYETFPEIAEDEEKTFLDKTLYRILDPKLAGSGAFFLIFLGNMLIMAGTYIPFTFLPLVRQALMQALP